MQPWRWRWIKREEHILLLFTRTWNGTYTRLIGGRGGERERSLKCHCLSRPSMMNQWFTCLSWEREQLTDGERTTKNNNLKVEWEEKTVTVILFRYEGLAFTIHSSARYIHMYMYISGRSSCSVVMSIAIRIIGTHHAGRFIAVTVV